MTYQLPTYVCLQTGHYVDVSYRGHDWLYYAHELSWAQYERDTLARQIKDILYDMFLLGTLASTGLDLYPERPELPEDE